LDAGERSTTNKQFEYGLIFQLLDERLDGGPQISSRSLQKRVELLNRVRVDILTLQGALAEGIGPQSIANRAIASA
jgi:hypothetical protein